jgi:flagellar basal-body rod protein FlgG
MNQGIYSLAATMVNQLNRVEVTSNNLANANTNGFKEDNLVEGSFNYYLRRSKEKDFEPTKYNMVTNTVPKIDGNFIKKDVGSLVITGNTLDFAIKDSNKFFKIKDSNNNIILTRDGGFKNLNGFLVTHNGLKVLNTNNKPITIEDQFEKSIALVETDFKNLNKIGDNTYKIINNKNVKNITNSGGQNILQGSIEKSNVNTIIAMVSLIDSQRRLEQSQTAMKGIDDMNQKLISKLGSK